MLAPKTPELRVVQGGQMRQNIAYKIVIAKVGYFHQKWPVSTSRSSGHPRCVSKHR